MPQKEEEIQVAGPEGEPKTEKILSTKIFTYNWFRSFIQRAFLEAYGVILEDDEVEKWVKGFNSVFKHIANIGPYHDAYSQIEEKSEEAIQFKKLFFSEDKNYLANCFDPAKKLAKKYMKAAQRFFKYPYISNKERAYFLGQIPDADLTSPLLEL
jgi:hypothetical protein